MPGLLPSIPRVLRVTPYLLLLASPLAPAAAQITVTVQGGVHAARLDRPERAVVDPGLGIALEGAQGEASTLGLRVGGWLSDRWGVEGGLAVSRNRSWNGGSPMDIFPGQFETRTLFSSATIRARIPAREARVGLTLGAGPALIFHQGSGTSLLTRNTDIGGLVNVGGSLRLSRRLAFSLDLQQYLYSSSFAGPYSGQFLGDPVQPAGSQFRHDFVILAGIDWRFRRR